MHRAPALKSPLSKIMLLLHVVSARPQIDLRQCEQHRGEQRFDSAQQTHGEINRHRRGMSQLPRARGRIICVPRHASAHVMCSGCDLDVLNSCACIKDIYLITNSLNSSDPQNID